MPSYVAICRSLLGSFLCLGLCLAVVFAREDVPKPPVAVKAEATSPAQAKASELDRKILKEIQDNAEVKANLTHLSDVIGSRMTGSENLKKANQWARDKFQAYGLTNVVLEPYEIPAAWERGFVHMKLVEPDNGRLITAASRAWTPGTKGRFVGEVVVVEATKSEELDAYKGRFKNALVMLSPPSTITPISEVGKPRNPNAPRRPPFQGASMAIRQQITEMARVEGAACILSDSGKPHGLLNMTGGWRGPDRAGATEPLPSVFVTHDHYSLLHRLALRQNVPPTKVEIEIQAKTIPGPITVYNTVGEIKGSELPEEFVVIGAHLDSWDLGQGTTDNGTGSSVVLESARALGKLARQGSMLNDIKAKWKKLRWLWCMTRAPAGSPKFPSRVLMTPKESSNPNWPFSRNLRWRLSWARREGPTTSLSIPTGCRVLPSIRTPPNITSPTIPKVIRWIKPGGPT